MKNFYLFSVCQHLRIGIICTISLICQVAAKAQYEPMLKDGRTWKCIEVYVGEEKNDTVTLEYKIDGTSEIDGHTCYNLCLGNKVVGHYYEEGPQVFHHPASDWELLFDFSLSPGDAVSNTNRMRVKEVKTVEINGLSRRCLYFPLTTFDDTELCWIEGVGSSLTGPYYNFDLVVPGNFLCQKLLSVYDDSICLFEADNFMTKTNVKTIDRFLPKILSRQNIYDLQGHFEKKPKCPGIYIWQGRKQVIRGKIEGSE